MPKFYIQRFLKCLEDNNPKYIIWIAAPTGAKEVGIEPQAVLESAIQGGELGKVAKRR